MAQAYIAGFVGTDPELRYTPDGTAVCNFSLGESETRNGETTVSWFRVSVWEKLGEQVNRELQKGMDVAVVGRLKVNRYQGKDGQERTAVNVSAKEVLYIGKGELAKPSPAGPTKAAGFEEDEDLPF